MSDLNNEMFSQLDELLSNISIDKVSSESTGFEELKDGYYLCEVINAELKLSQKSGNPMASFQLKALEDGVDVILDEDNEVAFSTIKGSKGRNIFKHFVLKDERSIKSFISDMLKFEASPGESFLPKEAFTTSEVIDESLAALIGMRIYVQISTNENQDGTTSSWTNFLSWKRVSALELPQ